MAKMLGNKVLVGVMTETGRKTLAYGRGCTVERRRNMEEVSSPVSGRWRTYLPGRTEATVRCESLLSDDVLTLVDLYRSENPVVVCVYSGEDVLWEGEMIVTSLREAGRIGEMALLSVEMKG